MEALTTLDLLYLVLSLFVAVVGTLLTIVLLRVIKILGPVLEILSYYNKLKQIISTYSQIPAIIKEKVMGIIKKENKKDSE